MLQQQIALIGTDAKILSGYLSLIGEHFCIRNGTAAFRRQNTKMLRIKLPIQRSKNAFYKTFKA